MEGDGTATGRPTTGTCTGGTSTGLVAAGSCGAAAGTVTGAVGDGMGGTTVSDGATEWVPGAAGVSPTAGAGCVTTMTAAAPATAVAVHRCWAVSFSHLPDRNRPNPYRIRRLVTRPFWMWSLMAVSARRRRRCTVPSVRPISRAISRLE